MYKVFPVRCETYNKENKTNVSYQELSEMRQKVIEDLQSKGETICNEGQIWDDSEPRNYIFLDVTTLTYCMNQYASDNRTAIANFWLVNNIGNYTLIKTHDPSVA